MAGRCGGSKASGRRRAARVRRANDKRRSSGARACLNGQGRAFSTETARAVRCGLCGHVVSMQHPARRAFNRGNNAGPNSGPHGRAVGSPIRRSAGPSYSDVTADPEPPTPRREPALTKPNRDHADALARLAEGADDAADEARPAAKPAGKSTAANRPSRPAAPGRGRPPPLPASSESASLPLPSALRPSAPRPARPRPDSQIPADPARGPRFALEPAEAAPSADIDPDQPASPPARVRPRSHRVAGRGGEPQAVRVARTTIPTCLLCAVTLPILALAWLFVPESSPLRVGGAWVVPVLLAFAALSAVSAAVLMLRVAAHYRS